MIDPLVSIPIITYNSSRYVLEALESAKAQTYRNIELIVSDDCSTDDTISIVQKWLESNKDRFVNTTILTVERNTGVSGNVQRAYRACKGEWVKGCAGDDKLLPNCVEDNVNFIKENPDAKFVLSNSIVFFDDSDKEFVQKPGMSVPGFFDLDATEQYEQLVRNDILMNPNSQFVKLSLFDEIAIDDRFKNMEDRPFFWNCTKSGIKLYHLDKQTVKYRKYEGALTGLAKKRLLSIPYNDSWTSFFYVVRKAEMEKRGIDISSDEKKVLWYLFVKYVLKNKGNLFTRQLNRIVTKWLL